MYIKVNVPNIAILTIMPFTLVIFSSLVIMISAFSEPNNIKVALMKSFDMKYRVPEKEPLLNTTIPLLQCMILCVYMPSCLSVFVSKGETCKGYQFTHRYLVEPRFSYSEEERFFSKGNAI